MLVKLKKGDLQVAKYNYSWERDPGDSAYRGRLDQIKVSKREGYEVLYFIEHFLNIHDLDKWFAHRVEDELHHPALAGVQMRDDLDDAILRILRGDDPTR